MTGISSDSLFPNRQLTICYWNADTRVVDKDRLGLEQHLRRLGNVQLVQVASLESPEAQSADLYMIAAQMLPKDKFTNWLNGLLGKIKVHGQVWTPALILADVDFEVLREIWSQVTQENWYFDILAPAHVTSLPIRVANLLRIHDHLHELKRYSAALDDINVKVRKLEAQLPKIKD